jgi:hydrogenase maturation protease
MTKAPRSLLVVCVGNPDRGDDGFGPLVAKTLAGALPADVKLTCANGDVLGLIPEWSGVDGMICIDAAALLTTPGRIHRFDLATTELPRDMAPPSSHALGLAEAIALARALEQAPRHIIIYAVEGASFAAGAPMTPAVAAAAAEVVGRVVAEVQNLR